LFYGVQTVAALAALMEANRSQIEAGSKEKEGDRRKCTLIAADCRPELATAISHLIMVVPFFFACEASNMQLELKQRKWFDARARWRL